MPSDRQELDGQMAGGMPCQMHMVACRAEEDVSHQEDSVSGADFHQDYSIGYWWFSYLHLPRLRAVEVGGKPWRRGSISASHPWERS